MFSSATNRLLYNALRRTSIFAAAAVATYNVVPHSQRPARTPLTLHAFADSASLPNANWSQVARRTGAEIPGLPKIPAAEIRKHNGKGPPHDNTIWVTFGSAVYDVTDFVSAHPGGDQILLAAGGPLEPFWALYAQHKAEWVFEILEQYRIGNVVPDDQWNRDNALTNQTTSSEGPYANEPQRHPALIVQSQTPFNAEPDPQLMAATQLTPNDLFYVRNHMPVPLIDPAQYTLDILDMDGKLISSLSLDDLKTKFKKYTVAATVQCAGNRRNELNTVKKVKGGKWDAGAISNAEWSGVRLRDVLEYVNAPSNAKHICFEGLDADPLTETVYAASIPFDIVDRVPDVLLAYEMNGQQLPRDHGYPVRAVIPGVVGARNVKWLGKVVLSHNESDSHWQKQDYRSFSPDVDWDNVDFSTAPSIQEMPVVSAICAHKIDEEEGTVTASGYAWSGDGKAIIRVDVSADGGKTWTGAELKDKGYEPERNQVYDWTLWSATLPLPEKAELVCKAIDSAYNTQPDSPEAIWNLRGLLNNSWHRVHLSE